jgi:PKD repeat protein
MTTFRYRAVDNASNVGEEMIQALAIDTVAPSITVTASPSPGSDGTYTGPVTVTFTAVDNEGGSGVDGPATATATITGPGTGLTAHAEFRDRAGNVAAADFGPITIRSALLALGSINAPTAPQSVGTSGATISVSASVTDAVGAVSYTWGWDDGTPDTTGTTTAGMITATHKYLKPGIYTVTLAATDASGSSAGPVKFDYVVVYDPNGGFVTGGGWINSPAGAFSPDVTLKGKGLFGYVSKYLRGSTVPTGAAEFVFHSGKYWRDDLWFHSSSYDFLAINGNKAYCEGSGYLWDGTKWNCGYKFLISSIDGNYKGARLPDKFRMKIWNKATGEIVYDSMFGTADDGADPTMAIAGGSIVIHK